MRGSGAAHGKEDQREGQVMDVVAWHRGAASRHKTKDQKNKKTKYLTNRKTVNVKTKTKQNKHDTQTKANATRYTKHVRRAQQSIRLQDKSPPKKKTKNFFQHKKRNRTKKKRAFCCRSDARILLPCFVSFELVPSRSILLF